MLVHDTSNSFEQLLDELLQRPAMIPAAAVATAVLMTHPVYFHESYVISDLNSTQTT